MCNFVPHGRTTLDIGKRVMVQRRNCIISDHYLRVFASDSRADEKRLGYYNDTLHAFVDFEPLDVSAGGDQSLLYIVA